jgi:hypothetical protein
LYSLIPPFITLFLKRTVLQNCTCKSNCYDYIDYIHFAAVSLSVCCTLEFLNICLQDVHLLTPLNVWMTFNCNVNMFLLSNITTTKIMRTHTPTNTHIRGGASKSLAWPGRKQATATKLGIYSTYSPRSSRNFLACSSNFCKPLKKIRILSVQPVPRLKNNLHVGRKMAKFQLFFQSRKQVEVRRPRSGE